jgi:hypothetical protein
MMSVPEVLTPEFAEVAYEHKQQKPMIINHSGCQGICKGLVLAPGYNTTCTNDTVPFDFSLDKIVSYPNHTDFPITEVFTIYFGYAYPDDGTWYFTTKFLYSTFNTPPDFGYEFQNFSGFLLRRKCKVLPALIEYSIVLLNDTVSLDPGGSWLTDRTVAFRPADVAFHARDYRWTVHGGVWLYLQSLYASGALMWYSPLRAEVELVMNGSAVFDFAKFTDRNFTAWGTTWRDPTFDVVSSLREIAFRNAMRPMIKYNETARLEQWPEWSQSINMEQTSTEIVYRSRYDFLAIAVVIILCAALTVLFIFRGMVASRPRRLAFSHRDCKGFRSTVAF